MMRTLWITAFLVGFLAVPGIAEPRPPGKGFWKILVKPKAKWVLKNRFEKRSKLIVRTYDVRKVGEANVARLRWTLDSGDSKTDDALSMTHAPPLTQVAVTKAGLYLLTAEMDDAQVAEALKKKPARSDPPKAYKGTTTNEGRYLEIRDGLVCMGSGPAPGDEPCEDTCEGEICISATAGIVLLTGTWTPGVTEFVADGFK